MSDFLSTLQQAGLYDGNGNQPSDQTPFDPTKDYGTPPQMLDNLENQESSGGKHLVNPTTGAMGPYQFTPSTIAMLRDQGVKFDPFDPKESRAAADWYLQKLKAENGGTYQGALKAYGGFDKTDPTQYINHVMNGVPGFGGGTVPGQSSVGQSPSTPASTAPDFYSTLQSYATAPQAAPTKSVQPAQPATQIPTETPLQQFGHAAAGLADTVLGAPGALAQQADYALRRAAQQAPQQAQQASQSDFNTTSTHPLGTLFGVTNTPGYQGEITQRLQGEAGKIATPIISTIAQKTGLPEQDVANMAGSLAMAAPSMIKRISPLVGDAVRETALSDVERPEAALSATEKARASYQTPGMEERPVVGGGAASTNLNPYPVLTGEDTSRGAFPQVKLSKIAQDVPTKEQAVRANIVNQIMGDNAGSVRSGVITGNENTLRDEYTAAKSPNQTPSTQALKAQIANEQQALTNFAEKRIEATGASPVIANDEERGRIINDALYGPEDSLSSYLKNAKNAIYDQAKIIAGDKPIQTQHVDSLFSDPQFQAGVKLANNEGVFSGAQDLINLARNTGFRDPVSGETYAPNSVAAWDAVRKSLNSQWSPSNSYVIRQINGAIDKDIAATGGQELYKLGDRIHQTEKTLLDSKGIGSVLGDYDVNGVKTGPSLESIPKKLNSMPLDQWQHIHDTLDDLSRGKIRGAPEGMPKVPTEVMQAAAQAKAEMDGSLARSVYEAGSNKAGVWNQNSVNKVLNSSVGQKIMKNFPPDEIQAYHTLNYGGQIMPGVHSYEGAGLQASRLSKPGFVEKYAPPTGASMGAAVGSHIPIPGAGWAGAAVGEKVGSKLSDVMGNKRLLEQYRTITDEMKRNSELGKSSGIPLNSLTRVEKGPQK